jgi:hypothetical protein
MPFDDPASLDLRPLFRDPAMFDSRGNWGAAGFQVFNRANNGKIMVARHPAVRGLLFKKYANALTQRDQLKNYERRVEGSRRLRGLVDQHGLSRVIVPRKWIVELPRAFSRRGTAHMLIVEQLELLGDEQTKIAYQGIAADVLAQLCLVLFHFRGMDSNAKNLPFTVDGRIALIDTEHWDRGSSKAYLHHVGEYLDKERHKVVKKIFRQLEDGEIGRGAARHGGDAEITSDSSFDNFDEDTSSSSS